MKIRTAAFRSVLTIVAFLCHPLLNGVGQECASRQKGLTLPEPSDFPEVRVTNIKPKRPNLVSALDKKYRTVIRESTARGPNFSGRYVVSVWGCGTGCSQFVIVDAITGTVFDPPFAWVDFHYPNSDDVPNWRCYREKVTYSVDSRLLIVEGCLAGKKCGRNYFVMRPTGLHPESYDPDLEKDGSVAPF